MSSAYSTLNQYTDFVPPQDLGLMARAMQVKQSKFDMNLATIQGEVDIMTSLDLIKDEDKQYAYERVKALVSQIPKGIDLSSNSVTSSIRSHIKQALDTNVVNALSSTKNFRNFQTQMQTLKEKNPEQYNVVNEMYALRPYMQWVNDGKAGTKMGSLSYTPYSDPMKKINDILQKAMTSRGTYKFQERDPSNEFALIEKEYSGLDENMIANIAQNYLDVNDRNQLAINGWYNMGGASNEQAISIRDKYISEQQSSNKGNLTLLKDELKKTTNPVKVAELKSRIESYKAEADKFDNLANDRDNAIGTTTEGIGKFFETQKLVYGVKSMFGRELKSVEVKADQAYKNKIDAGFELEKLNLEKAKFQLQLEKHQKEMAALAGTAVRVPSQEGLTAVEGNTVDQSVGKLVAEGSTLTKQIEEAIKSQYTNSEDAVNVLSALRNSANMGNGNYEDMLLEKIDDLKVKGDLSAKLWDHRARKEKMYNMIVPKKDIQRVASDFNTVVPEILMRDTYDWLADHTSDSKKRRIYEAKVNMLGGRLGSYTTDYPTEDIDRLSRILELSDGQVADYENKLQDIQKVNVLDAWNILPTNGKFAQIYAVATSAAGQSFNKDLPIQISKTEEGRIKLTQWRETQKTGELKPTLMASQEIDAKYLENILGDELDFSGASIDKKMEFNNTSFKMSPYYSTNDSEVNDNVKSYFNSVFGANSDGFRKLVYAQDMKQFVTSNLKNVNERASNILTGMIDKADKFTVSTKKSKYSNDIIMSISNNEGLSLGSTTIPKSEFENMNRGMFMATPQIIMSRIIQAYTTQILQSSDVTATPDALVTIEQLLGK